MRFLFVLVLFVLLPAGVWGQDEGQPEPESEWGAKTEAELLLTVVRQRSRVDFAVFEELAGRGSAEALEALQQCAPLLFEPGPLDALFAAIATYATDAELGPGLRVWLAEQISGELFQLHQAATRALASYGSAAQAELEQVVAMHSARGCREIAVGGLVTALRSAGTPEALDALLENYRYPNSGTRELGVRTIAGFDGPESLRLFAKALKDSDLPIQVKTMILEALVPRAGDDVDELLERSLRSKSTVVQLYAIEALAQRGGTDHYRELERLESSRDAAVRHAALVAQAEFRAEDEPWTQKLFRAAGSRDYALRMGSVAGLVRLRNPDALVLLEGLLDDENHLVRAEAASALGTLRERSSIPLLVERMGDSMRVRRVAREALVSITGLDHGATITRWRAWWEAEGAGFRVPPKADAAAANAIRVERKSEGPTEAEFYGIRIDSDRVCFVVDTSGSMDALMYSGSSRMEVAKRELSQAIADFPEGGKFNLVFFSDRARPWKRRLVDVDDGMRKKASSFTRGQRVKGSTALYDGLLRAFEDEEVDTIVLLSDGHPTKGKLVEQSAILEDITIRNSLRGIVIHSISVNRASTLLEGLADATGGTYREVR